MKADFSHQLSYRHALALMLALLPAPLLAAEGWYLGPTINGTVLDSRRTVGGQDEALGIGPTLGYRFFNDWALDAYAGTDVLGDELEMARLSFYYWPGKDRSGWRPYIVSEYSYFDRTDEADGLMPEEENTHQLGIGLGFSKALSDHWEFRIDGRLLHKIREGQNGTNDGALNVSALYHFKAPKSPVVVRREIPRPVPAFAPEPEPAFEEDDVRTIVIRLNIEFEFDKAVVKAIYGNELQTIANAMQAHTDLQLVLEGHTDHKGSDEYNFDLSARRAAAVKAKLVEDYALPAERIKTIGYGESRPIDTNTTEEGRTRNRRVIGELSYTEVL